MSEPVLIRIDHLSRRERAALQEFDARTQELTAAGELLDWYADGLPILCGCVHRHYATTSAAKKAFIRLAEMLERARRFAHEQAQGRA